jgi:hypothetical protein
MAFSPVDLPIQEMLQSDFIVDLATIHNSNVLLLKDKLEDIINNFEIDTNTISIGVDNPINSIKTQDIVIQGGGFVFQTGMPNQIIARLEKNGSDESVLTVDNLVVDSGISVSDVNVNSLTVNNSSTFTEDATFDGSIICNSQMVESKESVTVLVQRTGTTASTAVGTLNLTNTSRKNIYVTLEMDTDAVASTRVYDGTGSQFVSGINEFALSVDFDLNNPPVQNSSFTIYILNVTRSDNGTTVLNQFNAISSVELNIEAGTNQSTSSGIVLHYDLAANSQRLGYDFNTIDLKQYGANASFNYIVDASSDDRLMIKSLMGFDIL